MTTSTTKAQSTYEERVALLERQLSDLAALGVPRDLFERCGWCNERSEDEYFDDLSFTPERVVEFARIIEAYLNKK